MKIKKKFMGQILDREWEEVLAVDEERAAIEIAEDYEIYNKGQYQESYAVKIKSIGGGTSKWLVYCTSCREYNAIPQEEVRE